MQEIKNIVTLDFETFWNSKDYTLSKMGPISYIRDPRFSVQLMSVRVNDGPVAVFDAPDIPHVLKALALETPGTLTVGHNICGFDGLILAEHYGVHPWRVLDTIVAARQCGIARLVGESHKVLTEYLQNGEKEAGTVVSDGKRWPQEFTADEQEFFKRYCLNDTLQCYDNFRDMVYDTWLASKEDVADACTMTMRMATQSKFYLDKEMLIKYAAEQDAAVTAARQELGRLFFFNTDEEFLTAVRSPVTFSNMLKTLGVAPPMKFSEAKTATLKKKAHATAVAEGKLEEYKQREAAGEYDVYSPALSKNDLEFTDLLNHPDERVVLLVSTRLQHNTSILRSRTDRLLAVAETGKPLPMMLSLLKAHTSRYAAGSSEGSDGLNVQNFNKRDPKQLTLRRAIKVPSGYKLVAGDSSQIEARLLAYVANETELLDHFRYGRDPYSEQASKIYGIPAEEIRAGAKSGDKRLKTCRNVGKTAVLSAGYQVGAMKFSNTLLRSGIHLDPDVERHHALAKEAHAVYRASNPNIVQFWKTCQTVVALLAQGDKGFFGGPDTGLFIYTPKRLFRRYAEETPVVVLPTSYLIVYKDLAAHETEYGVEFTYQRRVGKKEIPCRLYGGALTENVVQGTAFQLMLWQALRLQEELHQLDPSLNIAFNIHDAWGVVTPDGYVDKVEELMNKWLSAVPDWLPGFPVACEVEVGTDFTIA